jgi:hypothetical protein
MGNTRSNKKMKAEDIEQIRNQLRPFERLLASSLGKYYSVGIIAALIVAGTVGTGVQFTTDKVPDDEYWEVIGVRGSATFDQSSAASLALQLITGDGSVLWESTPFTNATNGQTINFQFLPHSVVQNNSTGVDGLVKYGEQMPDIEYNSQSNVFLALVASSSLTLGTCYLIYKRKRRSKLPAEMQAIT